MTAIPAQTVAPVPLPPIEVLQLQHHLNRVKRLLADQLEVFAQAGRDVAALTESVARKEAELKAAREAAQ